jgi:hypothetical protein
MIKSEIIISKSEKINGWNIIELFIAGIFYRARQCMFWLPVRYSDISPTSTIILVTRQSTDTGPILHPYFCHTLTRISKPYFYHTSPIPRLYRVYKGGIPLPYFRDTCPILPPYGNHTGTIRKPYGNHTENIRKPYGND